MKGSDAQRKLRAALTLCEGRAEVTGRELIEMLGLADDARSMAISRKRSVAGRARVDSAVRASTGRFETADASTQPAHGPPNDQQATSKRSSTSPANGPANGQHGGALPPHTPPLPSSLPDGSISVSGYSESSSVVAKDLEGSAGARELVEEPRSALPTVVPLNLVEKARAAGVFETLRVGLERAGKSTTIPQLEESAREFVSYWAIGNGSGQQHACWMRKLREHIRKSALADRLPAPGLVEARTRASEERERAEASAVSRRILEAARREQSRREGGGVQ